MGGSIAGKRSGRPCPFSELGVASFWGVCFQEKQFSMKFDSEDGFQPNRNPLGSGFFSFANNGIGNLNNGGGHLAGRVLGNVHQPQQQLQNQSPNVNLPLQAQIPAQAQVSVLPTNSQGGGTVTSGPTNPTGLYAENVQVSGSNTQGNGSLTSGLTNPTDHFV